MRRLLAKPKERRKVQIPVELRDSLRGVFDLIQRAKRDPDIGLDYDDAIQVGAVCGGRIGKKPRPYILTYFPPADSERGRWYLVLDSTEVEDIGDGRISEMTLYCCTSSDCRCKFRDQSEKCFYCDYVDDPNFGIFDFPDAESKLTGRGVAGIAKASTQEEVIRTLGAPDWSGGGVEHPPLGYVRPWIKYQRADCQLRFEFEKDGTGIRRVDIMESDWEPGK